MIKISKIIVILLENIGELLLVFVIQIIEQQKKFL